MEIYAPPLDKWFGRGYDWYRSYPKPDKYPPLYAVEEQRAWITGVEVAMGEDLVWGQPPSDLPFNLTYPTEEDTLTTAQILLAHVKDTELLEQLTALV